MTTLKELNKMCNETYSSREKCVQKMKNVFSAKEIYLITVVPQKVNKNKVRLKVCVNTCDGLENHYQAEINQDLIYLVNRCLFKEVLPPPAIAIKDKKVGFLVTSVEQFKIVYELFLQNNGYELGYLAVMSENLPTLYPPENNKPNITSEN